MSNYSLPGSINDALSLPTEIPDLSSSPAHHLVHLTVQTLPSRRKLAPLVSTPNPPLPSINFSLVLFLLLLLLQTQNHSTGANSVLPVPLVQRDWNAEFYNSFKIGDLGMMQSLWSKGDDICCVHPGALGISGYEAVIDSWIHVWANYEFPLEIELREVRVHVRGVVGYVTCLELVKTKGSSWGGQFVTNVFEQIDGRWFICIHHASRVDF